MLHLHENNFESDRQSNHYGIGFFGLLQVAFIVLKLIGTIEWSWIWVLSPIWIQAALVIILSILYVIVSRL